MTWQTVIGLEVHAQIKTNSKLFSEASTAYGAHANSQTHFIDAGLPGTLPVLNQAVVKKAIQFGLAINAEIVQDSQFERKNYFYPDLPKGYQISQFQRPIVKNGQLRIQLNDAQEKLVLINRAHIEEDAGKSVHDAFFNQTGIDLNRAGTPLLEIVTEPCLYSAEEAIAYLKTLHQLVRFIDLCDGNMQEGSFRCDVNLSVKDSASHQLGVRTELKNLNSFRFIEKAIHFEEKRHRKMLESGESIFQETRLYNPDKDATYPMRTKESENDYRYFPDPDLLPIAIDQTLLSDCEKTMPELPWEIESQLLQYPEFAQDDIDCIMQSAAHWQYFSAVKALTKASPKTIVNWLKGPYATLINETQSSFEQPLVAAETLADLLEKLDTKAINHGQAKNIFQQMAANQSLNLQDLIAELQSEQVDESELSKLIENVIANHPEQVAQYKSGKDKLLGFFVGQVMKETKGKANPQQLNDLVKSALEQ
jgi:aspartyl-tRNA(Asn)/glutamyl-tRNA(Gln) amidotransferase subunit B